MLQRASTGVRCGDACSLVAGKLQRSEYCDALLMLEKLAVVVLV